MKIIPSRRSKQGEIPFKVILSFESVFTYLEEIADNPEHILYDTANSLIEECAACPELKEGFGDMSLLYKYEKEIDKLLDILFQMLKDLLLWRNCQDRCQPRY